LCLDTFQLLFDFVYLCFVNEAWLFDGSFVDNFNMGCRILNHLNQVLVHANGVLAKVNFGQTFELVKNVDCFHSINLVALKVKASEVGELAGDVC